MLRIPVLCLVLFTRVSAENTRLRGGQTSIRDEARKLPSAGDLSSLKYFGLDPHEFTVTNADTGTFIQCNDVKVCLPLSVIIDSIDDAILQLRVDCTSVEGCSQGECRHVPNVGLLCDAADGLLCGNECVYDDLAGDENLP
jgi:hypothetical protein